MDIGSDILIRQAQRPQEQERSERQERRAEGVIRKDAEKPDEAGERSREVIKEVLKVEQYMNRNLRLEVEKETGDVIAKIVDEDSGEVIRQIPPAELVAISKKLKLNSLLVHKEA